MICQKENFKAASDKLNKDSVAIGLLLPLIGWDGASFPDQSYDIVQ